MVDLQAHSLVRMEVFLNPIVKGGKCIQMAPLVGGRDLLCLCSEISFTSLATVNMVYRRPNPKCSLVRTDLKGHAVQARGTLTVPTVNMPECDVVGGLNK